VSLCTVVSWWIDALHRKVYWYDLEAEQWRWDLSLLPDAYRVIV
jgi:hypothetical protein